MASRDMADGVCHRHHREAEGQGHTKKANADLGETSGNNCASATSEG
jgi:hypothetical protein